MECGCFISRDCGDEDIFWDYKVTRYKSHSKCSECNRIIPAYEQVQAWVEYEYNENGDAVRTMKNGVKLICKDCQSVVEVFFCDFVLGAVWEDMDEHIDDDPDAFATSLLSKVTPTARASICKMIEKAWERQEVE